MLVSPDKPLRLSSRWRHIHLLFADLVGVLLLPTLVLCHLKLGGSKTAFLAVFHAEVFLLGLVLPLAPFVQWAHRQQNVRVGIVTVGVVNGSVGAHSVRHKLFSDKFLQQLDLFFTVQLYWQSHDKLTSQSAVLGCLDFLYGVPELFTILPFLWGIFRQKYLLPDKPLLSRVVMLYPVVIVVEAGTAQISGGGYCGASRAPADHLRFQMINCHVSFTSLPFFCFSFAKEKMDGQEARPSLRQSCRWQVCAVGWENSVG